MINTITVNNINYPIRQSFGVILEFEKLRGKKISEMNDSITDITTMLYAMLKFNNKKTFTYSFDEFIEIIDVDESIITQFTSYLLELQQLQLDAILEDLDEKKK